MARSKRVAPSKKRAEASRKNGASGGRPAAPRRVRDYVKLGARPEDPLEAAVWMHAALTESFEQAMTDPVMTERERRLEMRQIAKAMAGLVPAERLLAAERTVRRAAEDMAKPRKDPGLTDVGEESSVPLRLDS